MKYYRKELPDRPVVLRGQAYRFDLMAVGDGPLADALEQAAQNHVGGVISISEQEYQDLKKNANSTTSSPPRRGREEVSSKLLPLRPGMGSRRSAAVGVDRGRVQTAEQAAQSQDVSAFIPPVAQGIM